MRLFATAGTRNKVGKDRQGYVQKGLLQHRLYY